ncbi:Two-component response regulator SSK1p [Basidiobolus ranarum]|uniref:Two-component response regulator SSK1p n=1 Tax=Basidiobolus ranarum TaxID=34480 RepID=A0ABR2W1Z3_9FUNG
MGNERLELSQSRENTNSVKRVSLPCTNTAFTENDTLPKLHKQVFSTDETRERLLNNSSNIFTLLCKSTTLAYLICMLCSLGSLSVRFFTEPNVTLISLFFSPFYFLYVAQLCFWSYSFITLTHSHSILYKSLSLSLIFSLFLFSIYLVTFLTTLLATFVTSVGYLTSLRVPRNYFSAETSLFDSILLLSSPFFLLLLCLLTALDRNQEALSTVVTSELKKLTDKVSKVITENTIHNSELIKTLTTEFEQATSMAVQTVKQLSPQELLIKPQEHVSACSIPIPTASVTAIHSSLRHIISISSHLDLINQLLLNEGQTNEKFHSLLSVKTEFEIGDLMQSIGDILAGTAAEAKVELVLCHGDCGLHHMNVLENEEAFRHALINSVKSVIASTKTHTAIELGLHLVSDSEESQISTVDSNKKSTYQCTIEVLYTPSQSAVASNAEICLDDLYTKKLIEELGGEVQNENREKCQAIKLLFKLPMAHSALESQKKARRKSDSKRRLKISDEPGIKELTSFSNTLRGLRVALHAKNHSTFAKHLTSCLTIWGTDITHISIDMPSEAPPQSTSANKSLHVPNGGAKFVNGKLVDAGNANNNGGAEDAPKFDVPPSFIIIDDDVKTLRDQFISLRNNPAFNFSNHQHRRHKRMEFLSNHMITSIIHFTSLSNYQQIKDEVYSLLMMPHHLLPPQVLVIPKPVGPKRLLTALYTAVMKPKVDPSYVPIATSPMSPGLRYHQSKEEEKNPMDMINFDTYRPPTDSSMDSIAVPTPSNGTATPIAGTIVFDPKQFASNGQQPVVSALSRVTPYLNRKTSDQNTPTNPSASTPGASSRPALVSPMINGKPIALPPIAVSRSKASPGMVPVISSPILRIAPLPTPLSAPLPETLPIPTSTITKGKSKASQKKKAIRPSSATSKSTSALSSVVSPPINVLIVEDNPINQTILSTFMRKRKIKYSVANNGLEAVEKWKEGGFHLVLMDIQLPVMDGIEATKKIRSIEKMQKIGVLGASSFDSNGDPNPTSPSSPFCSPVIILALTASSLQSDRHAALAAGCNDFLTKPVSLVWLEKKIMEWGCMQALIDFEGWRKWKSQDSNASPTGSLSKVFSTLNKGKESPNGIRESLIPLRKSGVNKKSSQETLDKLKLPSQKTHKKSSNETKTNPSTGVEKVETNEEKGTENTHVVLTDDNA